MKIKTDTEFISFSDGICDIYTEDDDGNRVDKYLALGFSKKVLGFNRVFAAAANQIKANAVISVPQVMGIDMHDTLEIKGLGKYDIELTQEKYDTNPLSLDLTLHQLEIYR